MKIIQCMPVSEKSSRYSIRIRDDERIALFGKTGSGKTTLARNLLETAPRFAVLDPKYDFDMYGVKTTPRYNPKLDQQIIRVPVSDYELDDWDEAIDSIWTDGYRILYCDETTLLNPSIRLRPSLGKAIRTGRSRGIGTWIGSQRPKDIPSACFTECEHFFVFRLQWRDDRAKVTSFTTDLLEGPMQMTRGHDFVYYNIVSEQITLFQEKH